MRLVHLICPIVKGQRGCKDLIGLKELGWFEKAVGLKGSRVEGSTVRGAESIGKSVPALKNRAFERPKTTPGEARDHQKLVLRATRPLLRAPRADKLVPRKPKNSPRRPKRLKVDPSGGPTRPVGGPRGDPGGPGEPFSGPLGPQRGKVGPKKGQICPRKGSKMSPKLF